METKLFTNKDLALYNHYEWMVNCMKDDIMQAFEQKLGFKPNRDQITIESFELSDGNTVKEVYFITHTDESMGIGWKLADGKLYRYHVDLNATREEDLVVYREVKW